MPISADQQATDFDSDNRHLVEATEQVLARLAADSALKASFLGMLATAPADRKSLPEFCYFRQLEAAILQTLPAGTDPRVAHDAACTMITRRAAWAEQWCHGAAASTQHGARRDTQADEGGQPSLAGRKPGALAGFGHDTARQLNAIEGRLYERLLSAFTGALATLPQGVDTVLQIVSHAISA